MDLKITNFEFLQVWNLMLTHSFEIDTDDVQEDLKCIICKKLMIDACQSVCGCQYCHKCISKYLTGDDKHCPGDKKECQEEYLSIVYDVWRNIRKNTQIMKVKVMCPNEVCKNKIELKAILDHLSKCSPQLMLHNNVYTDSDIESLREMNFNNELENNQLPSIFPESFLELISDIHSIKKKYRKIEEDISSFRIELKRNNMRIKENFRSAENSKNQSNNKMKLLTEILQELKNEMEIRFNAITSKETKRNEPKPNEGKKIAFENDHQKINLRQINTLENVYGIQNSKDIDEKSTKEFIWKFDKFSKIKETLAWTPIYSDSFYVLRYKLCLRLYIDGDNVGFHSVILKGKHDDNLKWPMRQSVTLSIIDQISKTNYRSETFCSIMNISAFDRPVSERNYNFIGSYSFMHGSELKSKPSLLLNDSLIVSCLLKDI